MPTELSAGAKHQLASLRSNSQNTWSLIPMLLWVLHRKFLPLNQFFYSIIHWKPAGESLWENVQRIWEPIPIISSLMNLHFPTYYLGYPQLFLSLSWSLLPQLNCLWAKERQRNPLKFQDYFLWDLWLFPLPLSSAVLTGIVRCLTYFYSFFFCFIFPFFPYPQQTQSAYSCSLYLLV